MSSPKTIIAFGDAHFPHQDPIAVACLRRVISAVQPDELVCLGDYLDAYSISSFDKSVLRKRRLIDEIDGASDLLSDIGGNVKKRTFCLGNHCQRMDRILETTNNGALHGITTIPELLNLKGLGWKHLPYGEVYRVGSLVFSHDFGYCGLTALRQSQLNTGGSLVHGHSHALSLTTLRGMPAASAGWLGDFSKITYTNQQSCRARWSHGLVIARVSKSGISHVTAHAIVGGHALVGKDLI